MKKNALLVVCFLYSIVFISCSRINGKHSELNLRDSLRMQGKILEFYPDGKIKGLKSFSDSLYNGPAVFFNENGDVTIFRYTKKNKLENAAIDFDDSGKIHKISNWRNDRMQNYMYFTRQNFAKIDDRPVITQSSPFVTLDENADTIVLGDTLSAKIIMNFPLKGFDCSIYVKEHTDSVFHHFAKGTETEIHMLPIKTGEFMFDIQVLQRKKSEIKNKIDHTYHITFSIKCFVKPRIR